jgi:hypothetical protein
MHNFLRGKKIFCEAKQTGDRCNQYRFFLNKSKKALELIPRLKKECK